MQITIRPFSFSLIFSFEDLFSGLQLCRRRVAGFCASFVLVGLMALPLSAQVAQVQHAPSINGKIDGSLQQMAPEGVTLNGGAAVTGDLSVPGTPTIQLNGTPTYAGTLQGSGAGSPSNYTIMLNSGSSLRHVIRRTNAVSLPTVGNIPAPTGTKSVTINSAGQSIAWATLKNLTLNSNAGQYTVPAGSYGSFNAASGSGFKLGVAGSTQASIYNFQNLTLNGNSGLQILGPVVINLANGFSANAPVGAPANPAWLALNIKSGGFTLNSGCNFYGYLLAPSGQVIVNAGTQLVGGVACANLTVNGNGLLKLQAPQTPNQIPVVSLTAPANGSAYPAPGSFTLTATASDHDGTVCKVEFFQGTTKIGEDAHAPYSFSVSGLNAGSYTYFARVTDNTGATTDSSTIVVTVTSPNQPPTVSLLSPIDGATFIAPATIALTASAADADGTIAHVDFYQGSVLIGQAPGAPYSISTSTLSAGSYIFSAKAYDNSGAITTSGTITVTVLNPNQPPTVSITSPAVGASYDDPAGFPINASASDPDGFVTKVELFQNGSRVAESTSAPFTFPISGLPVGSYDFVARATDNQNSSVDSAPVRITVAHMNDAPVANGQTQTTLEDTSVTLTLTGSDPDGDALSYAIVTPPAHGTLVPGTSATVFVYSPAPDFNGADSFIFNVSDGSLTSAPATVQLNVTPVDDAPISYPAAVALDENTSTSFSLAATDIDSSALTFSLISEPAHGTISGALPNITYTPAANYSGADSLVYKIYDGELFSAPAAIAFTVNHVNRPPMVSFTAPVANASFISPASFILQAAVSDSDGTVAKVEFLRDGVKIGETSTAPYQFEVTSLAPGNYSFLARATDDSGAITDSALLPVTVVANIPPTVILTAPADGAVLTAPVTITISASAADSDGTIAHVDFYQDSTMIGQSSTAPYNFIAGALAAGTYSFSAKAYDNLGAIAATSVVTVTVINPNQPPSVAIIAPATGSIVAGPATIGVTASATDADGTISKVEFFNGTEKIGEATTAPFQISWPDVDSGNYTLTARATDNLGAISISPAVTLVVNLPPAANSQTVTTLEDASTQIMLSGSDFETAAASLTYLVITQPAHGSLTGKLPNLIYTPAANYAGSDTFTFKVNDGVFDSSPATVSITVQAVNHAPVATGPFSLTTVEDTAENINLTATDTEGSPLTYAIITAPQHGTLSGTAPNLTYIPSANYNGPDSFTYKANDGSLDSASATVNITVTPVNDIPVADSATFTVTTGEPLVVTLTGSDVETPAASLVFKVTSTPSHGTLSGTGLNLVYTPVSGYDGADSFTFIVNDGTTDSLGATVSIGVVAANAAPTVDAGEDKQVAFAPTNGNQPRGRIVVNNDEWALTDQGFSSSPYAGAFTRNLADFLTGGKPGAKFLAYTNVIPGSVDFIYTGVNLAAAMAAAGHTWVTSSTIPMTLANLQQYDAVFIGANVVDNQVLIDYVEGGGSVYLSAGTHWCGCDAEGEAALWNTFLEHFGLHYDSPYNGVGGTLPVFSEHPLFYGIKTLYFANGNSVTQLNPDDPYTTIPFIYNGQGLFGIYGYDLNQVFLHGTATDDGRPNPPASLTYEWTQISGPSSATLDAPNSLTTRVRFNTRGVYVFRLTANDGEKTSSDEVAITVNTPPQVYAGPDQGISNLSQTVTLAGNVIDDNVPHTPTILWKSVLGPGTVAFGSENSATTTATFGAAGRYVLELSADDGLEMRKDYVEVSAALIYPFDGPNGMVAWWPGNGTAVDVIGGHNGTLKNGATYSVGEVSLGFDLDGADDHIEVSSHPDLNLGASTAGLTIELWAKPSRNQDVPLVLWGTTTAEGVSFRQWNGGVGLYAFLTDTAGVGHQISVENMFSPNVWTHVAVTYDKVSGLARLFRNGIMVREQNLGVFTPQTTYPLEFGSLVREKRFYQGTLDEITFYNRALSAAEISSIYQAGTTGKAPPDDNQPPVISAGPNIVLPDTHTAASLNGTVSDDGLPENGNLSISWSKVNGPGVVTFENSAMASTTATFGAPGIYLLRLDADDGRNQGTGSLVTVTVGLGTGVEPALGIAAWWPGNGDPHEVIHGNHDVELFQGAGYGSGEVSQAFSFDGGNDYGRVSAHSDLDLGAEAAGLTIELWAKPGRNQDVPLVLWGTTTTDGVSFRQWNGGVGLYAFLTDTAGTGHQISAEGMFSANVWTHVAVTYDKVSGLARLYRNGVIVREQNLGVFTPQTTYPLEFGSLVREGRFYQGALDEITFYNRPLTAAEINAVYVAGSAGKTPPDDNQPPLVSAGPDVVLANIAATANLIGTVTDDNKPFGPPAILWTLVDGPGTVTFASASSAATTAIFSVPGTYLLKLTASDGYIAPVSDLTEVCVGIAAVEPAAGIAAWWPGNGDPHEVIHGNHDVELFQGTGYGSGEVSQAFSFDGTNDYGRVSAHSDLDLGAAAAGLTIELWAKPGRNQDVPLVVWGTTTKEGASFRQWNGGVGLYAFLTDTAGNDHVIAAEGMFSANVWTHVAVTYDKVSGLARLYRNGIIVREQNLGVFTPQTTYPLEFGSLVREGRFYQGALDEITFYNRPLTAAEINAVCVAGSAGKTTPDDNQPPLVSAGPDIVLANVAATAGLNGSVTDDNKPFGPPTILWTMADGPGIVSFANASSAATTATFSAPGTYLLKLTVSDGYVVSVSDLTEVRVGISAVKPASGIAAWWPGNGNPHEVIRGNHDVELFQGAGYGSGEVSQAFSFDGLNDYSRIAPHSDLNLGAAAAGLTIELWAKPGRSQDVPLVLWGTTTKEGVSFRQWNSGVGLYAFLTDTAGNDHVIAAEGMFAANAWIHVAVTYDKASGLARLYRNGIIVREQNLGIFTPQTTYPLEFGSLVREGRFYQGALDEITFYTRPLSSAEINAVFLASAAGKAPPDDNQPPVVSAGPDVVLANVAATANLNGSVTDDNKPFGPPTILWTVVDGPGTANFANVSAAATTATFSAPGTYLLKLTASDGYVIPVTDLTEVRVGVSAVGPASGIAAWWPGNGNPHEVIHGNHDVELFQGAGYGSGEVSQAFSFDGTNDYGRVSAHSDLDLGAASAGLTIELWAKPGRSQDVPLVLWGSTTKEGVSFRQWNSGVGLYAFLTDTAGNDHVIAAEGMFAANTWIHVAVTYDKVSGLARLYRNGIIVREQNLGVFTPQTTYPLEFGSLVREGRFYQGALDEITFYNRPLGAAEINDIYVAGSAGKAPIVVNAAPIVSISANAATSLGQPFSLLGVIVDDGLPNPPAGVTSLWSKLSGPGEATFSHPDAVATDATFSAAGDYMIRLSGSDSELTGTADFAVRVLPPPPTITITAPAIGGMELAGRTTVLSATVVYDGAAIEKVEFFDGAVKLGERSTPDVVNGSAYSLVINAGFAAGTHPLTVKATAGDSATSISDVRNLDVLASPPPAPVLELVSPALGAEVTAPVDLIGTVSAQYLKSYAVQVRYKTSANDSPWKTIATGTASVVNASLGQLDPTLLPNGLYEIRLSATDQLNRVFDQAAPFNWVQITGAMKIGANVSNTTDLIIPTHGLPLSVVRHYDSTDSRNGDFGPGTTLAGQACTVQVSQRLGENWYAYTVGGFNGLPQYVIDPAPPLDATGVEPEPRVVAITLPDNTTFRFTPRLTPNHLYTEIAGGAIVFDPLPGTVGQLEAVNESTFEVENDVLADSNFEFTNLLGIEDGEPLDPKAYRLTTLDGTQYVISTTKGVLKVTDRTGAWTTYSPTRIEQSNGTVIEIGRDAAGRITSVKDPSGQSIKYGYDSSGRLLTVLDREGHTTTYGYLEGTSLVTTVQAPGAILPEYDAYDAVGRLISKTNGLLANGDIITERDLANRIEKHRDALGRTSIVEYDEFGNVVRRTNARGNVTTYAFTDSRFRDKPTAVTDAEGGVIRYHYNAAGLADTVTDANGHATSYTYNATGQILTETDALGRATVQTYDAQGNLLTRQDRAGNITSFTYDSAGNRLTEHSPLGNEIRYTYNGLGLPLTETEYAPDNTVGRKHSYSYDANGNIASDSSYRADAQGILVPVSTSYTYNLNGQPIKTTYPDGTFSIKAYNTRGLLGSETDRSGAVVNYTYDDAGRLTRTTFADNSYEEKTYDAVGRVVSERNALGQISTNTYDDADHLLSIDFPGIGAQRHTYDKVGRMLTDTDESGRITSTAYDPAGNVTKVTYPDGTATNLAYNEVDDLMSASARVFFAPDAMDVAYNPIPAGVDVTTSGALAKIPAPGSLASTSDSADSVFSRFALPFGYRAIPASFHSQRKGISSHSTFARKRALLAQAAPPPATPEQHLYTYTYDANGRMTSITNPDASVSHIEYDAIGRPTKTINEEGQVWTYEYDPSTNDPAFRTLVKGPLGYVESYYYGPSGDMTGAIDPIGNITEHHYNTLGQCTEIKYSDSRGALFTTESFSDFDKEGNPRTITDREGFVTTIEDQRTKNTKSGDRVLTRTVGNESYVTTESYDAAGNLVQVKDPRGAITKYDYDFFNRRTLTTLPDGRKIETVYGPRNRVDKVNEIASDGTDTHSTAYEYDENDKVVRTVQSHKVAADSITVDSQYLSDGRAKTVSAPYLVGETPHTTTIDYDDVNRTVTITDPMGRLTVRKQDKLGRLIDDTDTAGTTTHREYDDLNRLTAITVTGLPDPVTHAVVSAKTTMTYDAMGNLLSKTEAADTADARTTSYAYEFKGNGTLVTTTFADGSKSKSFQDTRGLVTSTTTPRGNTVLTTYDAMGRPLSVTGPLGQRSDYTYPDFGKTQMVTDAAGRVTKRTFDDSQRLIEEKLPGSFGSRTYTYDSFSKLKTAKNTRGYTTTTEYDFLGRPVKVTRPDSSTIATTYTALGQPRRVTDARGFVTQYDYDPALHHLISMTAAEGDAKARTTAYGYDSADRMNQVTAPNGQVTDSVFDALGRLASRTATLDSDGTKYSESFTYYQTGELKVHHDIQGDTTHVYDAIGHLKSLTNPLNEITLTEYDSEGNLTKTTDALNRVTTYTYDALDRLDTTTLPQGATETNTYDAYHLTKRTLSPTTGEGDPIITEFGYDELDRLTATTRHHSPDNVVESRLYDGEGNLTKSTDAAGYETAFDYDSLNQLQTITHPDASTESFTYDGQGNRLTHTHAPIADDRTYTYTPHGEIETVTDALGHASSYTYDDAGNPRTATDPMGRVTTSTYDLANRLRKITQPGNRVSTFDYDTVGNRVAITDPANRTRRFEYDSLGRLKRALAPLYNALSPLAGNHSDPAGSVVDIAGQKFAASQLTYDPVGNLQTLTDPNNHTTTFKYDAGNRPTQTYLPANPTAAYEVNTYDFAGRRTARSDADGATTIYGYDSLSRLTSVQPPSSRIGANVGYTYDPRGLRSSMTDGLGTTNYTYDSRGRLRSEQTPYAGSMVYAHDQLGRLTNQHSTNLGGVNTTYEYDDASRLTAVVDALRSETTTYGYNDADQPTRIAQPNGTVTTQTYDAAGRPDVTTTSSGFGALFSQQYTYTPTDQVDTLTTTIGRPAPFLPLQNGVGYTYDSSDRLLREIHFGDTVNGQIDYTLDPAGNRTARSSTVAGIDAQSFVFNANNALASPFVYDSRGNPTAGPLFPGSFTDTYDYLDQHATRNGSVEYIYDGDGRRVGHRTLDPVSGRWITHTRLISSLNPTGYEQDAEEFTDGVLSSSYTLGHSRLAGTRFVDEAVTALGLTIGLGADGKVYAWGNGQTTPTAIPGLSNIIAVGAGASHYLALGADGKVYSWGASNTSGQLGRTGDIGTPTVIPGLTDVSAISTQLDHTLALTTDGTIYAWGENSSGQLGDGTMTNRDAPTPVATGAVAIAAGQVHSYALMLDGTAEAWGDNSYGQLGQDAVPRELVPTPVPGLSSVSEIAAGAFHALALKSDGTLVTWGDNTFGQLGDPAVIPSRFVPTPVAGIAGLTEVAAGARHSLALQSDGTLLAWGENRSGQLGTAYPANLYTPTAVPGLTNLVRLAAGARSSYATTADGATYVMGANRNGQLGTGNTASATTPQLLPAGTNPAFAAIASGGESGGSRTTHAAGFRDQFFAFDVHDHTRLLTDVAGATTQTYSYDGFGNLVNATDGSGYSLPTTRYPLLPATNPYLYRGERLEAETGRYHLRARDYDASLGRLATLDAFAGDPTSPMSLNRYSYAEANPVGNADPTGHFSISVWELLGQMDEINRQWDEIASVGRQEEFDPEQALANFTSALTGGPTSNLTITKKERAIWMNASRQGGLIGSLADDAAQGTYETSSVDSSGTVTKGTATAGYAAGSDVFFHTNANPRHRLSTIERTVEQAWASAYNLRHTINTGLPITSTDSKAWQTRWPAHLYHDAMLQAQLRSQMIESPVEARFTLSVNRKIYNQARVTLTASAIKNLNAAQAGGLLDWQSPTPSGTQGFEADFRQSIRATGFEDDSQYQLFLDGYREGYKKASPGIGMFAAGAVLAFVPGLGSAEATVSGMILSGIRTGLIFTGTKQVVNLAVGAQSKFSFKEAAVDVGSIAAVEFGFRAFSAGVDGLIDLPLSQVAGKTARVSRQVASRTIDIADNLAQDARALVRGGINGAGRSQAQLNMGVDPTPIFDGAMKELRLGRAARNLEKQALHEESNALLAFKNKGKKIVTQVKGNIQLAQKGVRSTFTTVEEGSDFTYAGRSVKEIAEELKAGRISPDEILVEFVVINGERFAVNNRSLLALRRAGLQPTRTIDVTADAAKMVRVKERLSEIDRLGLPRDATRIRGAGENASKID